MVKMKKAVLYILLFLATGLITCLNKTTFGQAVRLVSWEGVRINWSSPTDNPTYYNNSNDYIEAGNILGNNINFSITYERFQGNGGNGWPTASNPDYSKYIQISVSAKDGYQINLEKLKFIQNGFCNAYEIRYSTNSNFPSNGTLLHQNTNASASYDQITEISFPANTIIAPNETLYIRFYGYQKDQYNDPWGLKNAPYNLQSESSSEAGVAFYGEITTASSTFLPVALNDNASTQQNTPVTINILDNDNYSTLSAITFTQQPAYGNVTINGLSNVIYTPSTNYLGKDTFKYTITDENGTSGEATVSINITDPNNPCSNCTNTFPNGGGDIHVGAGQIYCLNSGTFTGRFSLESGGIICIAEGATFTPSEAPLNGVFNGTFINRGTVSFPLYNNNTYTATIENYGTYTTTNVQNFAGTIHNYGTFNMPSGNVWLLSSASIINQGKMSLMQLTSNGATITNHDTLTINGGLNVNAGFWNNTVGGVLKVNMTSTDNNVNFIGDIDNSGFWQFARLSVYSGHLNNYGHMQVFNTVNSISTNTYLTNDSLFEFINVPDLQFNGPLLTNNGRMTIQHGSAGNLKLNMAINQIDNNGIIIVTGQVQHNMAGSKIINNCSIVCKDYFVGNGTTQNNGLIWATDYFQIEGAASKLSSSVNGFVRGNRFRNSGHITGFGSYYFTGNTNFESDGTIVGDSATFPILFFDASQTANQLFDEYVINNPAVNIERPSTMTLLDTTSYNCTAVPTMAGYPPTTDSVLRSFCNPVQVNINLKDGDPVYVKAHDPVNGNAFTVDWNSLRLFDPNDGNNPTNNTTNLIITGKGVFTANATTGVVTFTPDSAFTSGSVIAEYKISNSWSGQPSVMAGAKTPITITISCYSPTVLAIDTTFCGADSVMLNMSNYISAQEPIDGFSFSLQWNTLKLFDPTNPNNPGNGTNSIHIANTGTFTIIQTNPGKVSFYPDNGFTGTATAEYQISNIWSKNNTSYTSDKMNISVHGSNIPAPNIDSAQTF